MDLDEFMWLLSGMSGDARFMRAWDAEPKHMYDPNERAALVAAARR